MSSSTKICGEKQNASHSCFALGLGRGHSRGAVGEIIGTKAVAPVGGTLNITGTVHFSTAQTGVKGDKTYTRTCVIWLAIFGVVETGREVSCPGPAPSCLG